MRTRLATWSAFGFALIGLGASIASLVDYLGPSPTFCAASGCATVRASAWAHPLGIPMPIFGIVFYALMLGLAVHARPRLRVALAIGGALWGLGLIGLQAFVIGAWCKLCMVADPAAIGLAVAVLAGARTLRFTWPGALATVPVVGAVVFALGFLGHAATPPAVTHGDAPASVLAAQVPGKVTLVEFVDFECPFCRRLQQQLAPALDQVGVPVHLVRKMVPLPQHHHAMPAALAYCCAEAQGLGEPMARALFAAPPEELTTEGCEKIAVQVGCDLARYRLDRPAMVGRVAADMLDALAANVHGLPTVFVGTQRLTGADHTAADLVAMIRGTAH